MKTQKRKTPFKHIVRGHKRKGVRINSYTRGEGNQSLPKINFSNPSPKTMRDYIKHLVKNSYSLEEVKDKLRESDYLMNFPDDGMSEVIAEEEWNNIHLFDDDGITRSENLKDFIEKNNLDIRTETMMERALMEGVQDPDFWNWANEGEENEKLDYLAKLFKVSQTSVNKYLMENQ